MLNVIRNNKIILFDPFKDNYEIIKNASLVCTINSKTGAESIILKKKFYLWQIHFYFFSKHNFFFENNLNKKRLNFYIRKKI